MDIKQVFSVQAILDDGVSSWNEAVFATDENRERAIRAAADALGARGVVKAVKSLGGAEYEIAVGRRTVSAIIKRIASK